MELEFSDVYKISLTCLKINGAHPNTKRDMRWFLRFVFVHGIYTIITSLTLYSIISHDITHDRANACANSSLIVIYSVISFQYGTLLVYQGEFQNMLRICQKDYDLAKTLPAEEKQVVINFARRGLTSIRAWVFVCIGTLVFIIKPLILMTYHYVFDEFRLVQIIDIVYPASFQKFNTLALYIVIFDLFCLFEIYSCIGYLGVCPLGPIFMLHACGQLELVKIKVGKLFLEGSGMTRKERMQKIKEIALQLQDIYDFVEHVKASFKLMYEISMKGTSVILPVLLFEIIDTYKIGELKLEFVSLFIGGLAIDSLPCYYGDLLMQKSEEVRLSLYGCGWETSGHISARKSILLLLTRADRPAALRSVFRIICLDTLADVYRSAYAIFNLLISTYN